MPKGDANLKKTDFTFMNIDTVFNIGDPVFSIFNGEVNSFEVFQIRITVCKNALWKETLPPIVVYEYILTFGSGFLEKRDVEKD